ncbi:hypothetical protein M885DRAFT_520334 [Pelagophyceae sp. CCMP2097]|nr:hypothetical protein M885DRAFT_520334 [Pelagophyceae sp. CCMP2097]|mmetsp:Transcript_11723/g.39173  ORF Transcript_11723/g.39173 Transcript_11723/m.39173 type:complete len:238 (-) Transcript_11723:11-724(-)
MTLAIIQHATQLSRDQDRAARSGFHAQPLLLSASATAAARQMQLKKSDSSLDDREADLFDLCSASSVTESALAAWLARAPDVAAQLDVAERTPLHRLAANAVVTPQLLSALVAAHPDAVRHADALNRTPLHVLCANEKITPALLEVLLGAHAPAGAAEDSGSTPLHLFCATLRDNAVALGDARAMLQLLLDAAPEAAHRRNNAKKSPSDVLGGHASPELRKMLRKSGSGSAKTCAVS